MDPTSELFILSNKHWPREREEENIIDGSVNLLYFCSQQGRARRQNYDFQKCDDGLSLQQAAVTCPGKFMPKCEVEYLSCAWLVSCPGLMGMTFKERDSAHRYIAANLQINRNYQQLDKDKGNKRKVKCFPTHLEFSVVCCSYYCNAWLRFIKLTGPCFLY